MSGSFQQSLEDVVMEFEWDTPSSLFGMETDPRIDRKVLQCDLKSAEKMINSLLPSSDVSFSVLPEGAEAGFHPTHATHELPKPHQNRG